MNTALTNVKNTSQVTHDVTLYCRSPLCDLTILSQEAVCPTRNAMCSFSKHPCWLGPYQHIWFDKVTILVYNSCILVTRLPAARLDHLTAHANWHTTIAIDTHRISQRSPTVHCIVPQDLLRQVHIHRVR